MSIPDKVIIKSKSLSLQRERKNIQTINRNISSYTDDGYVTHKNESNNSVNRKTSFKHTFLALFKNDMKQNQSSDVNTCESYSRSTLNRTTSRTYNSQSTPSNSHGEVSSWQRTKDFDVSMDPRDRQLMDKIRLNSITASIIDCINEEPCSTIKLPCSWIMNLGSQFSNSALIPFLAVIPGLMGIKNHGNTCYVNVILQCLAHIDSVAKYFSTKDYIIDIKPSQLNSQISDASGLDVLIALSYLLQSLWQQTYQSKISIKFCQLLTLNKSQFRIDSQQDAHELLLCILNLLHENLIRPQSGTTEETSFIYERFRGWLSNEITCPQCGYSRKFRDQILSLNLQIPKIDDCKRHLLSDSVFCIVINGSQIEEKHAFEINKLTTVAHMREGIADRLGCASRDVVLLELVESGFGKMFSDRELISEISQKNNSLSSKIDDNFDNGVYAVYIPNQVVDVDALPMDTWSDGEIYNPVKPNNELWDNQPFIRLLVVHVEKNKENLSELKRTSRKAVPNCELSCNQKQFLRFTNVLTVQAARKTKLGLLRHSLSEQMCKHLKLKNITQLPKPQFLIEGSHLVSEQDAYPLTHFSVSRALTESSRLYGKESAVVRVVVVWPFGTTQKLKFNSRLARSHNRDTPLLSINNESILLHNSVGELSVKYKAISEARKLKPEPEITITDCLRAFFSLDSVSVTEPWNCPGCQTTQQAHTNIRIDQPPEILILMLKRFTNGHSPSMRDQHDLSRKNTARSNQNDNMKRDTLSKKDPLTKTEDYLNKLECFIEYPLKNLDMKPYVENAADDENYLYDLVGVVNHRGNLTNGHYVAMCQNSIDNQWRVFDDDRVKEITEADVVHPDAYILFYKRQSACSDSLSDLNLHWSYRRLSFPDRIHRKPRSDPVSPASLSSSTCRNPFSTLPLSSSSTHNSTHSLNSRLTSIKEQSVLSPHMSSSSRSLLTRHEEAPLPLWSRDELDMIDITTLASGLVDTASCGVGGGRLLETSASSSSESAQDDSGAVLSRMSSYTVHDNAATDLELATNESYSSLSTSPATSSPGAAKKHGPAHRSAADLTADLCHQT